MNNKVAVVTGGARGIPRAVALDLASEGWSVAICYRKSEADAKSAVKEMESRGGRGRYSQSSYRPRGRLPFGFASRSI